MFISLVLCAFIIFFIELREFEKIVAFGIFEFVTNWIPLRIANYSTVKIELILSSLYISFVLFQITEVPTLI